MQLLDLPPEIRTRIWEFRVRAPGHIEILHHPARSLPPSTTRSGTNFHPLAQKAQTTSSLSIALTSRQLYLETTLLYYTLNIFHFTDSLALALPSPLPKNWRGPRHTHPNTRIQHFATAIGRTNTSYIRHLSVTYAWQPSGLSLRALPFELETLEVEFCAKRRPYQDFLVPGSVCRYLEGRKGMKVRLLTDAQRFEKVSEGERWRLGFWGWTLDRQRKILEGLGAVLI